MTTVFNDTFTGSGSIAGHAPSTPYGSQVWVDDGGITLSGGSAISTDNSTPTSSGYAHYGSNATDYGNPTQYDMSFSFTTPSNLSDGNKILQIFLVCGANSLKVNLRSYSGGSLWKINLECDVSGSTQYADYDVTSLIAASTAYTGVVAVRSGVQEFTLFGITITITDTGPGAFRAINLSATTDFFVNSIEVDSYGSMTYTTTSTSNIVFSSRNSFLPLETSSSFELSSTSRIGVTSASQPSSVNFSSASSYLTQAQSRAVSHIEFNSSSATPSIASSVSGFNLSSLATTRLTSPSVSALNFSSQVASTRATSSFGVSEIVFSSAASEAPSRSTSALNFSSVSSGYAETGTTSISSITFSSLGSSTAHSVMMSKSGMLLMSSTTSRLDAVTRSQSAINFASRSYYETLFQAWAMNSQTHAMFRYDGLPYKSVAVIGNRIIALGDTGFFELDADADDGVSVASQAITGFTKLGSDKLKRLGNVTIGYTTDKPVSFIVREYGDNKAAYTYPLPARTAAAPRGGKVKLGGGLRSQYYQFTIKGQSLKLDYAQVEVSASDNRRV